MELSLTMPKANYTLKSDKKMRAFLLTTLIAFLSVASLSAQTVRDKNNMKIGTIENQGTVRDANNMKVGSIDNNGTVRDRNNMKVGSIDNDGTIRDRNNMKIGSVGYDGTVRDRNNMKIGTANGVNMYHTDVYYFFNLL